MIAKLISAASMIAKFIQRWLFPALRPDKNRRTMDGTRERQSVRYARAQYVMSRWPKRTPPRTNPLPPARRNFSPR